MFADCKRGLDDVGLQLAVRIQALLQKNVNISGTYCAWPLHVCQTQSGMNFEQAVSDSLHMIHQFADTDFCSSFAEPVATKLGSTL